MVTNGTISTIFWKMVPILLENGTKWYHFLERLVHYVPFPFQCTISMQHFLEKWYTTVPFFGKMGALCTICVPFFRKMIHNGTIFLENGRKWYHFLEKCYTHVPFFRKMVHNGTIFQNNGCKWSKCSKWSQMVPFSPFQPF